MAECPPLVLVFCQTLRGAGHLLFSMSHLKQLIALLVLPLLASCTREAGQRSAPPAPEVAVVTVHPERVTLTRELPGRTQAFLVAEVRPQVTGIVTERLFVEGGVVEAGQPLYQLDDAVYRAEHESAQAALTRARASLRLAQLNGERAEKLAREEAVSRQEHENAIAALAQAEAEVRVAEAAVESSRVRLGYTQITAPIGGRIGKSTVTQGALVTANQAAPLATIQQLDPIYVDVSQSSRELLDLRKRVASGALQRPEDMPVTIVLEDGTSYSHEGKLAFSEVTVDPTTGSFGLRVIVPNPDHILLPGMYVRANIGSGVREDAILVPQQAVARDPRGNTSVMVVNASGAVEPRAIQVTRTIGDKWLVDGGLAGGDRVVIEGLQKIRPGMPVRIAGAPAVESNGGAGSTNSGAPGS